MSIATLDWLNSITDEEFQFFGLECELWRIGASQPAPKFNIVSNLTIGADKSPRRLSVSKPRTSATRKRPSLSSGLDLWNFLAAGKSKVRPTKPQPQHWASFSIGRSGFRLDAYALVRDRGIGVNLIIGGTNAKQYFHILANDRDTIESAIRMPLQWRELPQYKESQIYIGPQPADFTQRGRWPEYYTWWASMIEAYSRVFGPRIRHLQPDQSAAPKGTPEGIELSLGEPVDAH